MKLDAVDAAFVGFSIAVTTSPVVAVVVKSVGQLRYVVAVAHPDIELERKFIE